MMLAHAHSIGYAFLCVIVPVGWGLIVYWVTRFIERKILPKKGTSTEPDQSHGTLPVDYHI
jgi:hypothetical protein